MASYDRSGVTITVEPLPALMADQFDTLGVNVRSYREPLKRSIQEVLAPSFVRNFDTAGRGAWQPLVDATIKHKKSKGQPSSPLIATGKLRRVAGQFNLWTIDGPKGEAKIDGLPSHVSYGINHQLGWTPKGMGAVEVDPRPWAVVHKDDADDIEEVFFKWIEERIDADITAGRRTSF